MLIFVARPLAVAACLLPFRFTWQELAFIAWVGLRGAVPIVLAMFPWMAGIAQWQTFFNVAFVIVLMSLLLQGWTVAPLARLLKLKIPSMSTRVQRIEIGIPGQSNHEMVGYRLESGSSLLNEKFKPGLLPPDCRLLCIIREGEILKDDLDDLHLQVNDFLYLMAKTKRIPDLDGMMARDVDAGWLAQQAYFGEFILNPLASLDELGALYGFEVPEDHKRWSISRLIHNRYRRPVVGDRIRCGKIEFVVREMAGRRVVKVSLKLPHK